MELRTADRQQNGWAQNPASRERTVVRKPWSVEPVKVVAAKNKRKEKIEIGKSLGLLVGDQHIIVPFLPHFVREPPGAAAHDTAGQIR